MTVVSDAKDDGDQQERPSVLARPSSTAVVSKAPAATKPSGHRPISAATASARDAGVASAVAAKNRSTEGMSAFGARPGKSGSGAATSAISFALRAAAWAPRSLKSFDEATPVRPRETTRTRSAVSSRKVDWWISEFAKRVIPPHSWMDSTSTPSTPGRSSAAEATLAKPSAPISPGISAPRSGRRGTEPERCRVPRDPPVPAGPCRSWACPTGSTPRVRRPRRTIPRTPA